MEDKKTLEKNANPRPITWGAGVHPVGVGSISGTAASGSLGGTINDQALDQPEVWDPSSPGWQDTERSSVLGAEGARNDTSLSGRMDPDRSEKGWDSEAKIIETLNDLIICCRDGALGFKSSADQAERSGIKRTLSARAQDCKQACDELKGQVQAMGGVPGDSGSAMEALQRGWGAVKSAVSARDDLAILNDCERGEDNALVRYRKALQTSLPEALRTIVQRQYEGVKRNHDQIKMLRDELKTEKA